MFVSTGSAYLAVLRIYSSHSYNLLFRSTAVISFPSKYQLVKLCGCFTRFSCGFLLQFCSQLPNKENPSQRSVKIRQCWFISFRTANRRLVLGCNILLAFRPTGYRSQDAIFHLHLSSHFDFLVCFSIPALVFISAIPFHTCHQKKVV